MFLTNFLSTNFCKTLELFNLHLAPTSHTRITDTTTSTLDIIASTMPNSLKSCCVIPELCSSDHHGLLAVVGCSPVSQNGSPHPRTFRRYNLANFDLANDLLLNLNSNSFIVENDISASWLNFNNAFLNIMKSCIPCFTISGKNKNRPWLSRNLVKLIEKKNNLFIRAKHCPRLLPRYRKIRNQTTNSLCAARQKFFNNIVPTNKCFWKLVKTINGNACSIPTLKTDNTTADSDATKAQLLSNQFCKSFNTSTPLSTNDIISPPSGNCPPDLLISEEDVFSLLAGINCSKASGDDKISGTMLKHTAISIAPLVAILFNMSIKSGVFPDCWKTSNVSPIPKSGNVHDPANYHPISLLPVISKVFERHIHSLLSSSVSINENQWGFLSGHSSSGTLLSALHDWMRHLDSGHETVAVFFDLSKAFDMVPHKKLLDLLLSLNVPMHIVALISSYPFNRHQAVCVNGSQSPRVHVLSGVPQGSVLGPLLFIIYIDQIARLSLNDGTIILYADDLCLYQPINSQQDLVALQDDIDLIVNAIEDLALQFNVGKCKSITFSR